MPKTILITGSSSGIGRATVQYFAKKNWNVIATMRSPEKENELTKLPNVLLQKLDVTDKISISKAIAAGIEKFGSIDAIVNNAGYGLIGPFETSTDEQIHKQFDTNVFGVMNTTKAILPYFKKQKGGVIINVASMGGRVTFPLYSLYHATKWAVEGFSESLQFELRQFNIRVKIIEPGPINTDFYGRSKDNTKESSDYSSYSKKSLNNTDTAGSNGASPSVVAKAIYRAANSKGYRLRYQPDLTGRLILLFRRFTPDSVFNFVVRKVA